MIMCLCLIHTTHVTQLQTVVDDDDDDDDDDGNSSMKDSSNEMFVCELLD